MIAALAQFIEWAFVEFDPVTAGHFQEEHFLVGACPKTSDFGNFVGNFVETARFRQKSFDKVCDKG